MSVNRGKRSISLDIFKEEGQRLIRALAKGVDVLLENYVPGTMARLGLDYPSLRKENPGLVYASITGFGQDGPYARSPALDVVVQAMGGIMSVTGEQGGPPARPGASLGDSVAGLFAALAIVAALRNRDRAGGGEYIDISMLDCQVTMMENAFARYFATGRVPEAVGSRSPTVTPFQAFATRDGYITVALLTDDLGQWRGFCDAIGARELAEDPRFSDNRSRTDHHGELEGLLQGVFKDKASEEWLVALRGAGVPCGPVYDMAQVAQDPQVMHRKMLVEVPHPRGGTLKVANTPFKFATAPAGASGPPPTLGWDTEAVLQARLGLSAGEIEQLRDSGVL
jgi:CoA:oxalate CoA-transferase